MKYEICIGPRWFCEPSVPGPCKSSFFQNLNLRKDSVLLEQILSTNFISRKVFVVFRRLPEFFLAELSFGLQIRKPHLQNHTVKCSVVGSVERLRQFVFVLRPEHEKVPRPLWVLDQIRAGHHFVVHYPIVEHNLSLETKTKHSVLEKKSYPRILWNERFDEVIWIDYSHISVEKKKPRLGESRHFQREHAVTTEHYLEQKTGSRHESSQLTSFCWHFSAISVSDSTWITWIPYPKWLA